MEGLNRPLLLLAVFCALGLSCAAADGRGKKVKDAVMKAKEDLREELQREADEVGNQPDFAQGDPARLGLRFNGADDVAKKIGEAASVIKRVAKELKQPLGGTSPLEPNDQVIGPDEDFSPLDPGTCPWVSYECPDNKYRSFDGSCNNLQNPILGRASTPFKRYLDADYDDGVSTIRQSVAGTDLPNARLISTTISPDVHDSEQVITNMVMQWGQFLDHDITATPAATFASDPSGTGDTVNIHCGDNGCETNFEACLPIGKIPNDDIFDTKDCIAFVRSQEVPDLECSMGSIQQLNRITAVIDASNVYGSSKDHADSLRDISAARGRMKTGHHPYSDTLKSLLPQVDSCDNLLNEDLQCFVSGDERVNEQPNLAITHTVWMREHNRIENKLHKINPHWNGEKLYQETRRIVGAMMQHIGYNEYLPTILGPARVLQYNLELLKNDYFTGYDNTVDLRIANVFAAAAYRFGHSQINSHLPRADENFNTDTDDFVELSQTFFQPGVLYDTDKGGIDAFLRGLTVLEAQKTDRFFTESITKKLFRDPKIPNSLGLDLVALNLQRGRDHGLPAYNDWREWCGLTKATDFDDLNGEMTQEVIGLLQTVYDDVDDIDLFIGGVSESHAAGSVMGPTFSCILGQQFRELREGDRYWYENDGPHRFTKKQLKEIRKVSLAKVLCNNGDNISELQPKVMLAADSSSNKRLPCAAIPDMNIKKWRETGSSKSDSKSSSSKGSKGSSKGSGSKSR